MTLLAAGTGASFWWPSVGAVALGLLWPALHAVAPRLGGSWKHVLGFLALPVGSLCLWVGLELLGRRIVLATDWPLWTLGLVGALSVEAVVRLYRLEASSISRPAGAILRLLRVALVLLLILMLAQPVHVRTRREEDIRYVAVLIDDSASMHVPDSGLSLPERIRLAELMAQDVPSRPHRLEPLGEDLDLASSQVSALLEPLEKLKSVAPDQRLAYLRNHADELHGRLTDLSDRIDNVMGALRAPVEDPDFPLPGHVESRLTGLAAQLATGAADPLQRSARITAPRRRADLAGKTQVLVEELSTALRMLSRARPEVSQAARQVDAAFHERLSPEMRERIDQVSDKTRWAIAREILLGPRASLHDRLAQAYQVRLYRFASDVRPTTKETIGASSADSERRGEPWAQRTDLASALEAVMDDLGPERLSGVVVLSDGATASRQAVRRQVRRFSAAQVPVASVWIGASQPPRDAAISQVEAPAVLRPGERFRVRARLSATGLKGTRLELRLMEKDRQVAARQIDVPSESFVTPVELSTQPRQEGLHDYRLVLEPVEAEALTQNNDLPVPLSVRDDRIRLLLVEGRPRWEFRYLKNLFSDRDPQVKLQYVLLKPDSVETEDRRPRRIVASASAPDDQVEATQLPGQVSDEMNPEQRREEILRAWLKFDVILLGDVDPQALREEDHEALETFVSRKGGTLVVSAGPFHMPHKWQQRPLWDLLPVELAPPPDSQQSALPGGSDEGFSLHLTSEGVRHPVMLLGQDEQETRQAWRDLPRIFWRHPRCRARAGASILAYAVGDGEPLASRPGGEEAGLAFLRRVRAYRRNHTLICRQSVGRGQVLMLTFDRTWRLRYRVGDARHHRFWGQVMRWATADRLRAGTRFVRLGTDRVRYEAGSPVEVRARVVHPDYEPVTGEDLSIQVLDDSGREVYQGPLESTNAKRGEYAAKIAPLDRGLYTARLMGPEVETILGQDPEADRVETSFAVTDAGGEELADLRPRREELAMLADATGTRVTGPSRAVGLIDTMGRPIQVRVFRDDWRIWDSWPLLILIFSAACAEWLVRKKVQLP